MVGTPCGVGNSIILALQEACMKVCISHAGMLSGDGLALGASFWNLSIWKRERASAMLLHTPGTWAKHTLRLWCMAQMYSSRTKAIVCVARVDPLSQMSSTDRLSQWNRIF